MEHSQDFHLADLDDLGQHHRSCALVVVYRVSHPLVLADAVVQTTSGSLANFAVLGEPLDPYHHQTLEVMEVVYHADPAPYSVELVVESLVTDVAFEVDTDSALLLAPFALGFALDAHGDEDANEVVVVERLAVRE